MKKRTRKMLTLLMSAMLLVCLTVGATYAYLTSQDTVTNTFTVGNVAITLDEAKVDANGEAITGEKAERVKANEYKLMPGHEYDKDPTITVVKGSEECYVRALVSVNKSSELNKLFADNGYKIENIVEGIDTEKWTVANNTENNGVRTYELRYFETVKQDDDKDTVLPDLFTGINMPGDLTNEELATLSGLNINVVAQAIQADGFDTADEAWTAFSTDTTK